MSLIEFHNKVKSILSNESSWCKGKSFQKDNKPCSIWLANQFTLMGAMSYAIDNPVKEEGDYLEYKSLLTNLADEDLAIYNNRGYQEVFKLLEKAENAITRAS